MEAYAGFSMGGDLNKDEFVRGKRGPSAPSPGSIAEEKISEAFAQKVASLPHSGSNILDPDPERLFLSRKRPTG